MPKINQKMTPKKNSKIDFKKCSKSDSKNCPQHLKDKQKNVKKQTKNKKRIKDETYKKNV